MVKRGAVITIRKTWKLLPSRGGKTSLASTIAFDRGRRKDGSFQIGLFKLVFPSIIESGTEPNFYADEGFFSPTPGKPSVDTIRTLATYICPSGLEQTLLFKVH